MRLENRTAIVTGGAQGIGRAIAERYVAEGARVMIADIDEGKAGAAAGEIGCAFAVADVSKKEDVDRLVDAAVAELGHIDILVNNAGTDRTVPFDELTVEDWDRIVGTNLRGPFLMMKAVLPHLYAQRSGHVINVASTAAKRMWPNAAAYHASKWGLMGLSHAVFTEARRHKVKVSAIVVGGMQTPFILERFPDTPLENLQDPQNVADTILFVLQQPDETIIPEVMVVPLNETSWP